MWAAGGEGGLRVTPADRDALPLCLRHLPSGGDIGKDRFPLTTQCGQRGERRADVLGFFSTLLGGGGGGAEGDEDFEVALVEVAGDVADADAAAEPVVGALFHSWLLIIESTPVIWPRRSANCWTCS